MVNDIGEGNLTDHCQCVLETRSGGLVGSDVTFTFRPNKKSYMRPCHFRNDIKLMCKDKKTACDTW